MKKTWILLAVVAMIAALLAAPGTALAAKGDHGNRTHKTPGVTCAEFPITYTAQEGFSPYEWTYDVGHPDLEFVLAPGEVACWDVSGTIEGTWTIEAASSYVRSLVLQIKDSIPGDICWSEQLGPGTLQSIETIPMREAAFDACGTEWTDNSPSFVFAAASGEAGKGKKAPPVGPVTITVTLPTN